MRIHILGGSGSGKTTLGQELSARFHIPHYDLDKVDWKKENAHAIAERPGWVTEGIYLIFTEPMLYHADCIVLLEVPWPVAAWRIIRRHIVNSLRSNNPYSGINGIKLLIKLLKDMRCYCLNQDQGNRPSIESLHVFLETHRDIAAPPTEAFLQMYVEAYQEIIVPPTAEFALRYLEKYGEKVVLIKNQADRTRLLEMLAKS